MAKPSVGDTLTSEQLRTYKRLQILGQEYADEYALQKTKENVGRTRAEVLEGKEPTVKAPAFSGIGPKPTKTEPLYDVGVPTETTTEEEMGLTFESPFPETERERLEREARRPVEEDFIFDGDVLVGPKPITEDIGLPELNVPLESERTRLETGPVTAEENVRITPDIGLPEMGGIPTVYIPISPERAKEEPERVRAVTQTETGEPQVEEASRLQKIYSKFDDAEKAAYLKAKKELIQQGASLYEAEARAAQIVRGAISGPREILTAEKLAVESPELTPDYRVNPEFYQSEDVSTFEKFGEALRPKPLKSAREVAVEEASRIRGEDTRALIEEEVVNDLVAWRNGSKKFKGENYYVFFKDPVRGGIDQEKVDEWKQERFRELVKRTETDIKATIKRDLLDAEAAKGNVITPADPRYKEIDTQAGEVANIWTTDVAPEIARPAETGPIATAKAGLSYLTQSNTKLKWNSKDYTFDVVEDKGAPAFETRLGAGLRSVGGLIRGVSEPIAEFMSYEVNDKGEVLDKTDWNYGVHVSMQYAWDKIEKGTATPLDYAIAYNPFGAISSTGRTMEGSAPLLSSKKFAGLPATFGLVDGTGYFEDWAFATATGRWLGTDIAEAPVIKEYYDSRGMSYVPWIAGLTAELLLPVSSLTAAGRGVGTLGRLALAAKLPRVGEAVVEAGRFIEKPLRTTASALGNRIGSIRLYDALLESAGASPLSVSQKVEYFFKPAKLNEVAAEGVASTIARNIVRNAEFPRGNFPEFNNLVYKGKTLDAIYDDVIRAANGEKVKITVPADQVPLLSKIIGNRIFNFLWENTSIEGRGLRESIETTVRELEEAGTIPAGIDFVSLIRDRLTKQIEDLVSGRVETLDVNDDVVKGIAADLPNAKPTLIAADLVPDVERLFAETTFNDWVAITPTTIVKTKAWEKYGKQIDNATREIIFGNKTDEEIAKIISDDSRVVLDNPEAIASRLENYVLRTGKTPTYVGNLIDAVRSGEVSIDELNKINDLVKSEVAASIIPKGLGSAVDVTTTGRVTERAAVPVVRRATIPRAFETLERGLFGRVLSKGSAQFKSQTVFGAPFKFIGGKVPRVNIEISNAVERLTARINDLPNEVAAGWRKAIADGATPYSILVDEIDSTFNVGKVSKEQLVEDLSNIVKRFFTITDEGKLFKENYGVVINRLVDELIEAGTFGTKLADGTYDLSMSFELVKDILQKVQARFEPLSGKGLDTRITGYFRKTLDDEAILSLLIAQSLDKRRLAIIDEFGNELTKNYPELIVGNQKAFDENLYNIMGRITQQQDVAEDIVNVLNREATELGIPEGAKIGEPTIKLEGGVRTIVRNYIKDQASYNDKLLNLASSKILTDVQLQINKTVFNDIVADVYQKVIRNVSVEQGTISLEDLQTRIEDAFLERFPIEGAVSRIKTALKGDPELQRIDFTDVGTLKEGEVKFDKLLPAEREGVINNVIQNPSLYTNDADTIAKINDLRTTAGAGPVRNMVAAEANVQVKALAERVAKQNMYNTQVINKSGLFNPQLEAAIRATYVDEIKRVVNVNAVDIVGKLQATGIPINIDGGTITFSDVMLRAKQLGDVSVLVDNDTYLILNQLTSNNIYVERGLEALAAKNKELSTYLGQSLVDVIDYVRLRTIQGMLGGYIAPTTRFFGVNDFSAPLIAAVTNPTYVSTVAKAIPEALFAAPIRAAEQAGIKRVTGGAALTGGTIGAVVGGPVGAAVGIPIGGAVGVLISKLATSKAAYGFADIAPIITPSGKIITNGELNAILGRNKWRTSQIDFEFSDKLLSETVSALRSGVVDGSVFDLTTQHVLTLSRDRNWFNLAASESDVSFRRAVFKEGLARGLPEAQAASLARNTLLDYTAISEAERKTISRAILFYSFARQSLLETMMAFMREPTENAIIKKVLIQRAAADRAAKEYGVELEDYQKSRLWINAFTSGTTYDGKETLMFGIDDPMLSQFNTMLGILGTVSAYDYTNKDNASFVASISKWYAGKNPELDFVFDMYELDKMKRDGYFGMVPATELAALQEIGAMDYAIQAYDMEPFTDAEIAKLKEKYGGLPSYLAGKPTYNGKYYKFGTSEGASNFIVSKYISTRAGFQRGITDWAQMSAKTANVKNPELKRFKDGRWYLTGIGLETPMEAPDWLQIQYEIAQAQYRELQNIREGKGIKRITTEGE